MERENLIAGPPATFLLDDAETAAALAAATATATATTPVGTATAAADRAALKAVAATYPTYSAAWAALAENAYAMGDPVTAYAFARTGYHRGLDQLRRSGWRGTGPIPWSHQPNRGFLRALFMLGAAAAAIGEDDEAARCHQFLTDSSPEAARTLSR